MNRRTFIKTGGIVVVSAGLSGCSATVPGPGDTAEEGATDDADVSVAVVRNAPENPGPYEDPSGTVTPQKSDELALENIIFQRAGEKGLVVSGDSVNTSDRPFQDVAIEVTLYDENEARDDVLDSTMKRTERESLAAGETWQWAATFDDEPEFEIDYYAVKATASYD